MTTREKMIIAITTEILVTVVIVAAIFKGGSRGVASQPVTSQTATPTRVIQNSAMSAQQSSMDDHHGGAKPAEATLFNSLLNKPAPDFTLTSYDGKTYRLNSLRGKKVVLFFNEGIMCYPACWNQIAAFGKDKELADNAVVLNINVDAKKDWDGAVKKMPELTAGTVLLDTDRKVSAAYGVLTTESSMHRGQYPGHSYVVIDKEGIVRFVWDDPQMAVRNKEILAELAKL